MKKQFILLRNKTKPVYNLGIRHCTSGLFFCVPPGACKDAVCRVSTISRFHDLQFVEMCRQAPDTGKKMLPAPTGVPAGTQYKEERTKINHILYLTAHILYLTAQNSGFS